MPRTIRCSSSAAGIAVATRCTARHCRSSPSDTSVRTTMSFGQSTADSSVRGR